MDRPRGRCRSPASRRSRSRPRWCRRRLHSAMNSATSGPLGGQRLGDRMAGRDGDEARAEDRVGPGGEDLDVAMPAGRVPARRKRNCRPRLLPIQFSCISRTLSGHWSSVLEPVEQLLGEVGDLQEPLAELAPLDRRARAPALAVDHLLVGEHGHVDRVPIDLALLAIDQAGFDTGRGTAPARGRNNRARRWRARGSSRARSRAASAARASSRCWRGSSRRDGPSSPSPHFRPACRTRPSPSGGALRSPASAGSGRARRPSCSCGHGPCGCAPTDRGTSRAHRPWAWRWLLSAWKLRASVPALLPARVGIRRVEAARSCDRHSVLAADGGAAQVAGAGQDDVLELLDGRRGDRRVDPGAVLVDLAAGGDAQRVGAQVLVEDRDGQLDPLAGRAAGWRTSR